MNAIVGLCHFCEAHGPRPVFCTFTTDNEEHTTGSSKCTVQCNGCTSLGPETVLVSKDGDGTIFCSRETVPSVDVTSFLRQAAIRSITCEVNWSKEGGVVYFSDTQGHVLSFTFQLRDTRARGLKRWFSIVVLMKDKMLLLNIAPVLSEHMQKISNELQQLAGVVYDNEQKICSQRALRLRTGRNDFGQSRSLVQLTGLVPTYFLHVLSAMMGLQPVPETKLPVTKCKMLGLSFEFDYPVDSRNYSKIIKSEGIPALELCNLNTTPFKNTLVFQAKSKFLATLSGDEDIFKRLHSHFTWMLKTGAHTYNETLYSSQDLLSKLHLSVKGSIFEAGACTVPSEEEAMPLRALESMVTSAVFRVTMYCTLTGVNIFISPSCRGGNSIITGLSRLLPLINRSPPNIKLQTEMTAKSSCVLEEVNGCFCYKWEGSIPVKCPTLMNRIESAMSNGKFNDDVLHQQVKSLQLEWLGIARSVKAAVDSSGSKSSAVAKLKQMFGVTKNDEQLLNFWMSSFCE